MRREPAPWMNDASADQGVEGALAHVDTGWPLVMASDPAGPRRDFLLLSGGAVALALVFGLIGVQAHDPAMIAVFGGVAVLGIIGSCAMTRRLARPHQVALSTMPSSPGRMPCCECRPGLHEPLERPPGRAACPSWSAPAV